MASITIRDLPESVKEELRVRAAKAGISLEGYARQILQTASATESGPGVTSLLELSRECFGSRHGVELEIPARRSRRNAVDFGE